jgi:hypothetical protein
VFSLLHYYTIRCNISSVLRLRARAAFETHLPSEKLALGERVALLSAGVCTAIARE